MLSSALAPVAALLLGVAFLVMGNGLQGTLLPVRAKIENFSILDIGILGSAYFVGIAIQRMFQRARPPEEERSDFVAMSAATPTVFTLDPRAEQTVEDS